MEINAPESTFASRLTQIQLSADIPTPQSHLQNLVSKGKTAKDYYLTSTDPAAGSSFKERMDNLKAYIKEEFKSFSSKRALEYATLEWTFSSFDWATGHHATKTEVIAINTYIFTKISRTTNGDWKGGPIINGVDQKTWISGDIAGGNVTWTTGGHGKAETKWTIWAKLDNEYILNMIQNELNNIKAQLNLLNVPTDV
ncbi:hypothetical protein GCM10023149_45190 [Mucilaginibacter gynuensis]|uniref:Uncharacterized protein n=1 Tax=Mucilaginibacter gynuensis TaxID=1302236 RepID=A0ABP8H9Z0_9SPHI